MKSASKISDAQKKLNQFKNTSYSDKELLKKHSLSTYKPDTMKLPTVSDLKKKAAHAEVQKQNLVKEFVDNAIQGFVIWVQSGDNYKNEIYKVFSYENMPFELSEAVPYLKDALCDIGYEVIDRNTTEISITFIGLYGCCGHNESRNDSPEKYTV